MADDSVEEVVEVVVLLVLDVVDAVEFSGAVGELELDWVEMPDVS